MFSRRRGSRSGLSGGSFSLAHNAELLDEQAAGRRAWSRTVSLKQQGGKDEDRRCNGFDNEAKPGLQHDDLKPPTDASVDVTDPGFVSAI